MKTSDALRVATLPVVLAGAMALSSCGSPPIPTATEMTNITPPAVASGSGVRQQVLAGINRFRQSNGKPAFERDAHLDRMAQQHAEEMLSAKKMSHDGYHRRLGVAEANYGIGMLRENVFWSRGRSRSELSGAMVNGWANSAGHRRNLLAGNTVCGVGVATDSEGSAYASQLSGRKINRSGL